jgi:hypothetical protein
MRILGRTWDEQDAVGRCYRKGRLPTGEVCFLHVGSNDNDPIGYRCQVCRFPFRHFLVSDRLWATLPQPLQSKVICPSCFACGRHGRD